MHTLAQRYPSGVFLTLMVAVGLNDYQLKGKAEVAYWPPLRRHLESLPVPNSLDDLERILEPFYRKERLNSYKVDRLRRFLGSPLARRLWNMTPNETAQHLKSIWQEAALVMEQKPSKKTITFAAKALAIGLLLLNETGFDFAGIPVPVDLRLKDLTPSLSDDRIRQFWDDVLSQLRQTEPHLTHLHLDSFLWQYEGAPDSRLYLMGLGIGEATAARIEQTFETLKLL
jgi:DNA-(apurinic or apyrimidinic site) lyase